MASIPGGQDSKTCRWVPGPLGTRVEAGLGCPLETHRHHSPILICLTFSTSTSSDHPQQAQNRRCVSNMVTRLPQSSVQLHKCMEGWGGLCPSPSGRECQWEEQTHTDSVFNLLDEQSCHHQDSHTGAGLGRGSPLDGNGRAQGPRPNKGAFSGQCGGKDQASDSVTQCLPPVPSLRT